MENRKDKIIDTSKLRLAQIKYYDIRHCGIDESDDVYVFLYEAGGRYVNIFDICLDLPVYERVPYSNYTKSGEACGSKIRLIQGEEEDGPCYVFSFVKKEKLFKDDFVSFDDLKMYMFKSSDFFVDRRSILLNMMESVTPEERESLIKIIESDNKKFDQYVEYMSSHIDGNQYIKVPEHRD